MRAYVTWQNGQVTPEQMAAARFVEMPALHQTSIFRRAAVTRVLEATGGAYRDGPMRAGSGEAESAELLCVEMGEAQGHKVGTSVANVANLELSKTEADKVASAERAHGDALDVPGDMWWWLSFFHVGLRCGKLGGPPLFGWRQHPRLRPSRQ